MSIHSETSNKLNKLDGAEKNFLTSSASHKVKSSMHFVVEYYRKIPEASIRLCDYNAFWNIK